MGRNTRLLAVPDGLPRRGCQGLTRVEKLYRDAKTSENPPRQVVHGVASGDTVERTTYKVPGLEASQRE